MHKGSKLKILLIVSPFLILSIATVLYALTWNRSSPTMPPVDNSVPASSSLSENPKPVNQPQTNSQTSTSRPATIHTSNSRALELYKRGLELYYQRQFPQALKLFNEALMIDPQCYEALNGKGATLAFQGNYDQGLALIQQALEINPLFVYGNFNQGLANELAGRWNAAIEAYQKALQLDQHDTWSYYGIASIYGRLGNIDKVLEYLQPAIALNPDVKEVAREEKDFAPVQENPRFQALIKP
ncbi:tetratricopeptide repeat protein [Desulfosporosinus sp. SB140]|uniref:tetratricopeptide repeat protein n=1 Tax=Desulfosporosinus paludis TaxID=3115649 RepID=UPI0038910D77